MRSSARSYGPLGVYLLHLSYHRRIAFTPPDETHPLPPARDPKTSREAFCRLHGIPYSIRVSSPAGSDGSAAGSGGSPAASSSTDPTEEYWPAASSSRRRPGIPRQDSLRPSSMAKAMNPARDGRSDKPTPPEDTSKPSAAGAGDSARSARPYPLTMIQEVSESELEDDADSVEEQKPAQPMVDPPPADKNNSDESLHLKETASKRKPNTSTSSTASLHPKASQLRKNKSALQLNLAAQPGDPKTPLLSQSSRSASDDGDSSRDAPLTPSARRQVADIGDDDSVFHQQLDAYSRGQKDPNTFCYDLDGVIDNFDDWEWEPPLGKPGFPLPYTAIRDSEFMVEGCDESTVLDADVIESIMWDQSRPMFKSPPNIQVVGMLQQEEGNEDGSAPDNSEEGRSHEAEKYPHGQSIAALLLNHQSQAPVSDFSAVNLDNTDALGGMTNEAAATSDAEDRVPSRKAESKTRVRTAILRKLPLRSSFTEDFLIPYPDDGKMGCFGCVKPMKDDQLFSDGEEPIRPSLLGRINQKKPWKLAQPYSEWVPEECLYYVASHAPGKRVFAREHIGLPFVSRMKLGSDETAFWDEGRCTKSGMKRLDYDCALRFNSAVSYPSKVRPSCRYVAPGTACTWTCANVFEKLKWFSAPGTEPTEHEKWHLTDGRSEEERSPITLRIFLKTMQPDQKHYWEPSAPEEVLRKNYPWRYYMTWYRGEEELVTDESEEESEDEEGGPTASVTSVLNLNQAKSKFMGQMKMESGLPHAARPMPIADKNQQPSTRAPSVQGQKPCAGVADTSSKATGPERTTLAKIGKTRTMENDTAEEQSTSKSSKNGRLKMADSAISLMSVNRAKLRFRGKGLPGGNSVKGPNGEEERAQAQPSHLQASQGPGVSNRQAKPGGTLGKLKVASVQANNSLANDDGHGSSASSEFAVSRQGSKDSDTDSYKVQKVVKRPMKILEYLLAKQIAREYAECRQRDLQRDEEARQKCLEHEKQQALCAPRATMPVRQTDGDHAKAVNKSVKFNQPVDIDPIVDYSRDTALRKMTATTKEQTKDGQQLVAKSNLSARPHKEKPAAAGRIVQPSRHTAAIASVGTATMSSQVEESAQVRLSGPQHDDNRSHTTGQVRQTTAEAAAKAKTTVQPTASGRHTVSQPGCDQIRDTVLIPHSATTRQARAAQDGIGAKQALPVIVQTKTSTLRCMNSQTAPNAGRVAPHTAPSKAPPRAEKIPGTAAASAASTGHSQSGNINSRASAQQGIVATLPTGRTNVNTGDNPDREPWYRVSLSGHVPQRVRDEMADHYGLERDFVRHASNKLLIQIVLSANPERPIDKTNDKVTKRLQAIVDAHSRKRQKRGQKAAPAEAWTSSKPNPSTTCTNASVLQLPQPTLPRGSQSARQLKRLAPPVAGPQKPSARVVDPTKHRKDDNHATCHSGAQQDRLPAVKSASSGIKQMRSSSVNPRPRQQVGLYLDQAGTVVHRRVNRYDRDDRDPLGNHHTLPPDTRTQPVRPNRRRSWGGISTHYVNGSRQRIVAYRYSGTGPPVPLGPDDTLLGTDFIHFMPPEKKR